MGCFLSSCRDVSQSEEILTAPSMAATAESALGQSFPASVQCGYSTGTARALSTIRTERCTGPRRRRPSVRTPLQKGTPMKLAPCKLCGTLPHGTHMRIWCPNAACNLCDVVLSESHWQTLHGPPPEACQRCASGVSTMRNLCDKCFSAGVASERANPSRV